MVLSLGKRVEVLVLFLSGIVEDFMCTIVEGRVDAKGDEGVV